MNAGCHAVRVVLMPDTESALRASKAHLEISRHLPGGVAKRGGRGVAKGWPPRHPGGARSGARGKSVRGAADRDAKRWVGEGREGNGRKERVEKGAVEEREGRGREGRVE